jgi:hypothetical protein
VDTVGKNCKIYITLVFKMAKMNSGTKCSHVYCSPFVHCNVCTSDTSASNASVLAVVSKEINGRMEEKSKGMQFFSFYITRFSC